MPDPRPRRLPEALIVRYQQDPVFHRLVHTVQLCLREGAYTQQDLLDACEVAEALWAQHRHEPMTHSLGHRIVGSCVLTAEEQALLDVYHQQLAHAMTPPITPRPES
jgi:hypothetical protein